MPPLPSLLRTELTLGSAARGVACQTPGAYDLFHHNQDRVTAVIAALRALPPTDKPSLFTIAARAALPAACASRSVHANDLSYVRRAQTPQQNSPLGKLPLPCPPALAPRLASLD